MNKKNSSFHSHHTAGGDVSNPTAARKSGFVNPTLTRQFGSSDPFEDVVTNKLFQSLVKHVVNNTLEQRGIPTNQPIPGASSNQVSKMMAAICTHDRVAHYIKTYKEQFQGTCALPKL